MLKVKTNPTVIGIFVLNDSSLAEALDASETAVDVDDGADFNIGDVIKIDNEEMDVTNIVTNTLTVGTRGGINGTVAATHDDDSEIYVRPFEVITVSTTAVGFTSARIPDGVTRTRCTLSGGDIRYRRGGSKPLATIGELISSPSIFTVDGERDIKTIQFIRVSSDATLTIEHEVEA